MEDKCEALPQMLKAIFPGLLDLTALEIEHMNANEELSQVVKSYATSIAERGPINDRSKRLLNFIRIADVCAKEPPETFGEFKWVLELTCNMLLLRDTSIMFVIHQAKLIEMLSHINNHSWNSCPIKIHIAAKSIFQHLENDTNLLFVVRRIVSLNRMTFYVAIALVWAALHRFFGIDTQMFRIHKISELTKLLDSYSLKNIASNQLPDLFHLLNLVSALQKMQMISRSTFVEHSAFKKFFTVTQTDVKKLKLWLDVLDLQFNNIDINKDNQLNHQYMQIKELLEFDILNGMEKLMPSNK